VANSQIKPEPKFHPESQHSREGHSYPVYQQNKPMIFIEIFGLSKERCRSYQVITRKSMFFI